jgi:hypothetical protein
LSTFCQKLSLEKKHGALNMIPKANDKVCKGNSRPLHDPRDLACRNRKRKKKMLISLLDIKVMVQFYFIPQGQTVNQAYYMEILKRLHEVVSGKRSERRSNNWIFHHENTLVHKALFVKQFLAQISVTDLEHPPHSSVAAPNNYSLCSKIKCT